MSFLFRDSETERHVRVPCLLVSSIINMVRTHTTSISIQFPIRSARSLIVFDRYRIALILFQIVVVL